MNEKVMQAALEAGELGGAPSEVRAIEYAYAAAKDECARAILDSPCYPGFILDLCKSWLLPDPSGSEGDNG